MVSYSDQRLRSKLQKKRRNSVDIVKKATAPAIDYQNKMQYIEREIDRDLTYFSRPQRNSFQMLLMNSLMKLRLANRSNIDELLKEE